MAIQKKPPQEPNILYESDIKELCLENAKEILTPEHLIVFEKMMKQVYAQGFLNGQKSIITAVVVLFFTVLSYGQSGIVSGGTKDFTIGETFPIMQQVDTIVVEEVSLGVPKYEYSTEIKITSKKKVSFLQVLQQL